MLPGKLLFSMGSAADGGNSGRPTGPRPGPGRSRPSGGRVGRCFATTSGRPPLGVLNGRLIFAADDGVTGRQLYTSDGIAAGTGLLQRLTAGTVGSNPRAFTAAGPKAFFIADDTAQTRSSWPPTAGASRSW